MKIFLKIEKGTAKNKKWKAIFSDENGKKLKTSQIGDDRYQDYTQSKNKELRKRYRARHAKDLTKGNRMSPGYLSYYLLWGDSTSLKSNINSYKNKFKLK